MPKTVPRRSYRSLQSLIKRGAVDELAKSLTGGLDASLANENGWSLLMLAAVEGSVPVGELLIDHGANMTARNRTGESAIEIAEAKGHTAFADMLRERGAA